jgi:tripartite-type tricarboxylate transporter receptor subunit TctC
MEAIMTTCSRFAMALAAAALMTLPAGDALAQADYPNKPIRLIVGFAPGGGTDIVARIVGPKVGELLNHQRLVIDNRAGAAQVIASELTAKAAPDGYTLFMASAAFTINPALHKTLPFDSLRDFTPIALAAGTPNVLVVHPSVRARSIKELIAEAKAAPGKLLYGSAGVGAPSHLSGVLFNLLGQVEITHVPYKGSGQVMSDLLGGQLQMSFPALSGVILHIKSGKLIPLGVTSRQRSSALPDVPTIEESGLAGYEASSWFGLMGPAKMSKALVAKLNAVTNQALKESDVRDQLARQAADPLGGTPQDFADVIARDIERWKKVVAAAGIKPE